MYKIYILESLKNFSKHYIGHTHDLKNRLERHNRGLVRSTKLFVPWKIIYTEDYNTKQVAYKRELKIKSYKGGEAFKKLISKGG
jgi:putative endonuclease